MDLAWYQSLAKLLRPNGLLVLNILEPEKLPYIAPLQDSSCVISLQMPKFLKSRVMKIESLPYQLCPLIQLN